MSASQCKAARRRLRNDPRYKPKRGNRGLRKNLAKQRKVTLAGGGARSIGYKKKGQG